MRTHSVIVYVSNVTANWQSVMVFTMMNLLSSKCSSRTTKEGEEDKEGGGEFGRQGGCSFVHH